VSEETPRCCSPHNTSHVFLLIRRDDIGRDMSRYLVDRIERTPSIEMLLHTEWLGDVRSGSITRVASAAAKLRGRVV
jgi:hypothetical protein